MITSFWIKISSTGTVSKSNNQPTTTQNEVAMKLNIDLPDDLFKRQHLEATMQIPGTVVNRQTLTPIVIDNIAEAIRTSTGLDIVVKVVDPAP